MKKKLAFDNKVMTGVMDRYARSSKKSRQTLDYIINEAYKLIDAAIAKRHSKNKDFTEDLRQECALKVLKAVPKYNVSRGSAFGFLWAIIYNSLLDNTPRMKFNQFNHSMDSDEAVKNEATLIHAPQDNPERIAILYGIVRRMEQTLNRRRFPMPRGCSHKRACAFILKRIKEGDFFGNRSLVVKRLVDMGLTRKDSDFYVDYTLVLIRERLFSSREDAGGIADGEAGSPLPYKPVIRVLPDIRPGHYREAPDDISRYYSEDTKLGTASGS